ncbi:efflux RND transporter permease subunit [Ornithinimicrobium pratense]|uniref:Efflux RND transporter permease subunit n=1 Tax=Ornithinimicrobium pratense TaxID=2593973 RepID=A0A5J6V7B7_9MICO|nr:efflux RND transporter permease subunit [Ornithinimicrobium pratense]QFG68952.1 efflux RND transporter permease subunit [Ornithinimicrobium pratense]
MTTMSGPEIVNPRKAELRALADRAGEVESAVATVLEAARSALEGGAWVSSTARTFEEGITLARQDIQRAASGTVAAIEAEWASTPARIPANGPI